MASFPLSGRLYKFLRRPHAEAMVKRGQIRVGRLFEYTNLEQYKGQIGDAGEGTTRALEYVVHADENNMSDFMRRGLFGDGPIPPNFKLDFNYGTVGQNTRQEDLYIYCMSESYDWDASGDAAYDTCVEIVDPPLFAAAITSAIRSIVRVGPHCPGLAPVHYDGRVHPPGHPVPPELQKARRDNTQREWRFVWPPSPPPHASLLLPRNPYVPRCVRICRTK